MPKMYVKSRRGKRLKNETSMFNKQSHGANSMTSYEMLMKWNIITLSTRQVVQSW